MLFFSIYGDDFRGRSKTVKIVTSQIWALCWRRWKLTLLLKKHKPFRSFYFMFLLLINGKTFKTGLRKINYDFFKRPHKQPSQNFSWSATGWRRVSQKYNVIQSPDQYPCLAGVLSTWLIFSRESVRDTILHRLLFLSFSQKFLSFRHKIILPWKKI